MDFSSSSLIITQQMRPLCDQISFKTSNFRVISGRSSNKSQDLKSWASSDGACRFKSGPGHHLPRLSNSYAFFEAFPKGLLSRFQNSSSLIIAHDNSSRETTMRPHKKTTQIIFHHFVGLLGRGYV